ncbi:hypothetical protein [Jiangella alkaliphila]|uniref:Lipoprotein n=1 Tax=Jiangella alkaliphila TaxID=419479 RepID=A0A1H2JZW1_9ACTN|nr:hypothetical protein [Jiangella alkaliphila]SDU61852.1 hypothetical protein SAMN04488563_3256 [Jiangella alkaliphila]
MGLARTVRVAAVAAVLSGLPSTACAVAAGGDVLAATRAAGTLLPGRRSRPSVAGGVAGGLAAGAAIAALDLELVGRRYPAIRALPRGPQWLDHLAFGAVVGAFSGRSGAAQHGRDRR